MAKKLIIRRDIISQTHTHTHSYALVCAWARAHIRVCSSWHPLGAERIREDDQMIRRGSTPLLYTKHLRRAQVTPGSAAASKWTSVLSASSCQTGPYCRISTVGTVVMWWHTVWVYLRGFRVRQAVAGRWSCCWRLPSLFPCWLMGDRASSRFLADRTFMGYPVGGLYSELLGPALSP